MICNESALANEYWTKGYVKDCPIIDFHGHMGEFRSLYLPRQSPEDMLRTMEQCNVKLLLFCGHEALYAPYLHRRLDIEAVRKYPNRFKAYFALNANAIDEKADLKSLMENGDVFIGIKMLPDYYHCKISN